MDIIHFKNTIEKQPVGKGILYINQYNRFWTWKISVEKRSAHHILDSKHVNDTCKKLLEILPRWQTYRGVKCDYLKELPLALSKISDAYNEIRHFSLLNFQQIPDEPLQIIWDSLGRVKENKGTKRAHLDYFIIAVCKPLMFIWGQTLAFDSINRLNIRKDKSLEVTETIHRASRWHCLNWKTIMGDFQRELLKTPEIIKYCQIHSNQVYGTDFFVPYGRYLDLYYYY
jgi:hypothetical protein